jgi:Histidine kinase
MLAAAQAESSGADPARGVPETTLLLWLWIVFWLLMITVSIQEHLHGAGVSWWEPILWEGSSAVAASCGMLLVRATREYHARYLDRPLIWFWHYLRWVPPFAVLFITAVYAVRHGVYELVGRSYEHPRWPFVFAYESIKVLLFAGLWLGIVFGLDSYAQWQAQRRRLLELQRTLAETQLARLKAQLGPHFFFNALNTISALMHVDVARADRLLARLGELLRVSLRSGEHEMTSLKDELDALHLYAEVMLERFADRVTMTWRVDESVLDARVPSLLLQPLLENAFKHGVERHTGPVRIEVAAERQGERLRIRMSNSGSTLAAGRGEGVGLRNCRERLSVLYGQQAALRLAGDSNCVVAAVVMPLRFEPP